MKRLLTTTAIVAMSALPLAAEQHSGAKTEMSVTVGENEVRISNLMDATVYMPEDGSAAAVDSGQIGEVPESWTEIGSVSDVFVDGSGNVSTVVLTPNENANAEAEKLGLTTDSVSFKPGENDNELYVVYTGDKVTLSESEEFDAAEAKSQGMTSASEQQNAQNADSSQSDMQNAETQQDGLTIRASELSGHPVYIPGEGSTGDEIPSEVAEADDTWERVGEIGGVIISRDGGIKSVTLDAGGFLGMNEKTVETTMDELRFVRDSDSDADNEWFVVFTGDRSALEEREEYDQAASEQNGEQYMSSDDMAASTADSANRNDGETAANENSGQMGSETASDQSSGQMEQGTETAAATDQNQSGTSAQNAQADAGNDGMSQDASDTMLTAEELDGAPVYGANGDEIGNVSSLVMENGGDVSEVVIDVGGFLGIGEKPVAISYDDLQIDESVDTAYGDVRVSVNQTQSELEEMERWTQ